MKSLKLGRLFGISIELHSTFVILIVILAGALFLFDRANFFGSMVLLFFLFLSVFIHELFHSVVSLAKKIKVKKIVLLPIGGVSMAEEMSEKPMDEFLIAIAGPLFNFIVVFAILFLVNSIPGLPWPHEVFNGETNIDALENAIMSYPLFALFWVNLILGAFNLFVPALPMDGGRVLRSLLAMSFGYKKATNIATKISKLLAVLMFVYGLFANWLLMIIAVFVYLGAKYEKESLEVREVMKGVDFTDIIDKTPEVIDGELSVEEIYEWMRKKNQTAFVVMTPKGIGYVDVDTLEALGRAKWPITKANQITKAIPLIKIKEKTDKLYSILTGRASPFVAVVKGKQVVGIVSAKDLENLYLINKASKSS